MKKLTILLMILAIFPLASANLVITPNPFEITTQVNHETNFTFSLQNNYSFQIFDFSFPELESKGFTFPEITLSPNQSTSYQFSVLTTEPFYGQLQEKVEFKFWVDLPEEVSTHTIELLPNSNGINETYKTVRKGDTVRWINRDDITHVLKSSEFGTITINPNQSSSFIFNNLGTHFYYDDFWGDFLEFQGFIEVVERTEQQKAHNPNYDTELVINLNSISEPTNISVENSENNYTIEVFDSDNGLLTIRNTGSRKAEGINLNSTSAWIVFDQNNFDLDAGDTEWVEYTILPTIYETNNTNRKYNLSISIKAFNSEEQLINVTVFVPFKEITGNLDNDIDVALWYDTYYCPQHPCSIFCNPELPECSLGVGIGNSSGSSLTFNGTSYDLQNLKRDIGETKNTVLLGENEDKKFREEVGNRLSQIERDTNVSLQENKEAKKLEKNRNAFWWVIGSILILATLFYLGITKGNKLGFKKSLSTENINYRQWG